MNLDVINGSLEEFRRFRDGTFQHLDQIMGTFEMGHGVLYTPEGYGYFVDDGKTKLTVTRGEHNPLLHAIIEGGFERVKQQLKNNGSYWLNPTQTQAIVSAKSTDVFDVESLGNHDDENRYGIHIEASYSLIEFIGPRRYVSVFDNLGAEQKRLMQRFGLDSNSFDVLIATTSQLSKLYIQLLPPGVVAKRLETEGGSLWFASHVGSNGNYHGREVVISTIFSEIDTSAKLIGILDNDSSTANGVQENPLSQHYRGILADPAEAVRAMDDKTAQGLLKIIADYKLHKAQRSGK